MEEFFIGLTSEARETLRKEISYQALNYDLDEEEITYNIRLILDLLEDIIELDNDTIIKVCYNPMGCLNYEIIKDNEGAN